MVILKILALVFLTICTAIHLLSIISMLSNGKLFGELFHRLFRWHIPDTKIEMSGINQISTCKYCGKRIIKVQSDWFTEDDC